MADLRIYRTAMLPFVLAALLVAFSFTPRPRPLAATLSAEAFDGGTAMADLRVIAGRWADRRPGSAGDRGLAALMAFAFRHDGFTVRTLNRSGQTVAGRRTLETVIATRAGRSSRGIVLVAHRDAAQPGSLAELSGTAALVELGNVLSGRVTQRTVTLISTSGGSGGDAGAAVAAATLGRPVDAVIVLGDVAGSHPRRPYILPWSDGSQIAPIQLRRTVELALTLELGRSPGGTASTDQLARLAFPIAVSEQGPFLAAGLPAVLVQSSGELGPRPGDAVSPALMTAFGRGVLRAVTALDEGPDLQGGPTRDLLLGVRVLPGRGFALLVGTLIIAVMLSAVDVLARAMRRREPVLAWLACIGADAIPFALAGIFAVLLGRTGLLRAAPNGPVTSRQLPLDLGANAALLSVAAVFGLAWMLRAAARKRVRPVEPPAAAAAAALMLTLAILAALVWIRNPFAAALLLVPLHLWLFATALEPPVRRGIALALVLAALAPLAALAGLDAARLELGPLSFAWTALLLVAGGHIGLAALLAWCIAAGCLVGALEIAAQRPRDRPLEPAVTVRGPLTYAGPGSLGGTDSALRH